MNEKTENTDPKLSKPWQFKSGDEWTGNKNGRPKGSISIKDRVRQWLDEHPEDLEKYVKYFANENRELSWQMLEGSPKSTSEVNTKSIHIEISGADLLLAQELEKRRKLENIDENNT